MIASIATVAGPMMQYQLNQDNPLGCNPDRPLSSLQVQGTADPLVPFEGGWGISSAFDTARFWADLNNCDAEATHFDIEDSATDDNTTVTLLSYENCNDRSEVLLYRVNEGDHMWPGDGTYQGDFDMSHWNRDLNASFEILKFFERTALDDPNTSIHEKTWADIKSSAVPFSNRE